VEAVTLGAHGFYTRDLNCIAQARLGSKARLWRFNRARLQSLFCTNSSRPKVPADQSNKLLSACVEPGPGLMRPTNQTLYLWAVQDTAHVSQCRISGSYEIIAATERNVFTSTILTQLEVAEGLIR
jgi:hypothetical protein